MSLPSRSIGLAVVIAVVLTFGGRNVRSQSTTGPCELFLSAESGNCFCEPWPGDPENFLYYCVNHQYNVKECANAGMSPCEDRVIACFTNYHTYGMKCPKSSACMMDCVATGESCQLMTAWCGADP